MFKKLLHGKRKSALLNLTWSGLLCRVVWSVSQLLYLLQRAGHFKFFSPSFFVGLELSLYEGYVKNTNALTEKLAEMTHKKKASAKDPAFAELTRRLGFEYGGMVLHEYYFDNLAPNGKGIISDETKNAIEKNFTTFENWKANF